jgi:hypothetical protein
MNVTPIQSQKSTTTLKKIGRFEEITDHCTEQTITHEVLLELDSGKD